MMGKPTAALIIAASYFVHGLAVGLGDFRMLPDDFLMESLHDLARRHPVSSHVSGLPQLLQRLQKKYSFDTPIESGPTTITSSGVSNTGEVTLDVSFPQGVDVFWCVSHNGTSTLTKGIEGIQDVGKTTSLTVKIDEQNPVRVVLILITDSSSACLKLNLNDDTPEGTQMIRFPDPNIGFPDKAEVSTTDTITFDVTVPTSPSYINDSVPVWYIYTNCSSEEVEAKRLNYTSQETTTASTTQITINNVPDAIEGYLQVIINNGIVLSTDGPSFFNRTCLSLYVDVTTDKAYTKDMVSWVGTSVSNTMKKNDVIRYGSVLCMAKGHPKPKVTLSVGNQNPGQIDVKLNKFETAVYVPLDGMSATESAGTYLCVAESGSEKISKNITVV